MALHRLAIPPAHRDFQPTGAVLEGEDKPLHGKVGGYGRPSHCVINLHAPRQRLRSAGPRSEYLQLHPHESRCLATALGPSMSTTKPTASQAVAATHTLPAERSQRLSQVYRP